MTVRTWDSIVVAQLDVLKIRVVWSLKSYNVTGMKSLSGLQTRGFLGQLALNKPGKRFSTIKSFRNIKCC